MVKARGSHHTKYIDDKHQYNL